MSRSKGHSATAAAAYQHRCAIIDERTGQTHDYTPHRNKALFSALYTPKDAPAWASDRAQLWNAAERAEDRFNRKKNTAQVARVFDIALPHELTAEQNRWLLQDFVRENFTRKGYAADVAIHAPHDGGDARNIHAHVMVSLRRFDGADFSATKDTTEGFRALPQWRQSWQQLSNRHLERHGHAARIDHRSLKEQGIEREAEIHRGKHATAAARKGQVSERGAVNDNIQARNKLRLVYSRELNQLRGETPGSQVAAATPQTTAPPRAAGKGKRRNSRSLIEYLREEFGQDGGGGTTSESGVQPMADNEPGRVDKAFGYFQQVVGAVFDTVMPGGNAEQNPTHQAAKPNITINADEMAVNAGRVSVEQKTAEQHQTETKQADEVKSADMKAADVKQGEEKHTAEQHQAEATASDRIKAAAQVPEERTASDAEYWRRRREQEQQEEQKHEQGQRR